jgi:hypothetical protein
MERIAMNKHLLLGAAFFGLAAPAFAQTGATTSVDSPDGSTTTTTETIKKQGGGTAPGAAGGVVAGALVAGPIGALIGGIAGATVGHTVAPPSEVETYVTTQTVAPIAYSGDVRVGKTIDGDVAWSNVPNYPKYSWARLNGQRVVIDNDSHKVVAVY